MAQWKLDDAGFEMTQAVEYRSWINYMANATYGLRLGHLGDGFATTLEEPRRVITNFDSWAPSKGRFVYVQDLADGVAFNPSFYPTKTPLDQWSCRHEPGITTFSAARGGIVAESSHFLPLEGTFELWQVVVRNTGATPRRVRVFPLVEFLLYETFNVDPIYYSWFTNSAMEADGRTLAFFKTSSQEVYGFFHGLRAPQSWDASLRSFKGDGDMQRPQALGRDLLPMVPSGGDPYIACYHYDLDLAPGAVETLVFALGEGRAVLDGLKRRFTDVGDWEREKAAVRRHWAARLHRPEVDAVQDPTLRSWLRTFLPYQVYQQSLGLVRSTYRGYRDVAQDAMGMSYYDLGACRDLILTLLDKQYPDGRCLRQWNTSGQFHDERDFRDLPFWLPLAVHAYLDKGGDPSILTEERPWLKSSETATLFAHMVQGMKYALRFGRHDLLLMGVGDWNDALSGLGTEGESLWLNQMAYLALDRFREIQERWGAVRGLAHDLDVAGLMERCYQGVQAGWTGSWFLRGYHQDGAVVGGEERLFLLPQAWFTISGMARRDPERAKQALDAMVSRLGNDQGFLKCHPAFDAYDPLVGNLSALAPGMAENYAVYNHASTFAIYALFMAGRQEEALTYIKRLIPLYKDADRTLAEPYVLVNFYNGGYYPEKAGQGGIPWLTGTANWLVMVLFDLVFPAKVAL